MIASDQLFKLIFESMEGHEQAAFIFGKVFETQPGDKLLFLLQWDF